MKSFVEYLIENKDRFIKKNKNLTDNQKDEIIKYFRKNRQAEKKIDWNKSGNMTISDFEDIMMQSKMGRKKKVKCASIKIKGLTEEKDYINLRMKTKDFCAFIPLTFEAAQKFNTRELGMCSGPWCIGHSDDAYSWNNEVIEQKQVPVYVINTNSKWVVMIQEGNRDYDVWSIENSPTKTKQGIPGFSIRKELLNNKQKTMYDEIREDYYNDEVDIEFDIEDAEIGYDAIIEDIDNATSSMEGARERFDNETYRIKSATEKYYKKKISDLEEENSSLQSEVDDIQSNVEELEILENEFDDDEDLETVDHNGEIYSYQQVRTFMLALNGDIEGIEDNISNNDTNIYNMQELHDSIDKIEYYEMSDNDVVDWVDYPPSEEDIGYDIYIPSCFDNKYSDYFDLMEEHGYADNEIKSNCDQDIREYVYESSYGGSQYSTASEVLNSSNIYHPEILNNR